MEGGLRPSPGPPIQRDSRVGGQSELGFGNDALNRYLGIFL